MLRFVVRLKPFYWIHHGETFPRRFQPAEEIVFAQGRLRLPQGGTTMPRQGIESARLRQDTALVLGDFRPYQEIRERRECPFSRRSTIRSAVAFPGPRPSNQRAQGEISESDSTWRIAPERTTQTGKTRIPWRLASCRKRGHRIEPHRLIVEQPV